ncbi:MAG: tetratricopeptide repeat protein, partial [Halieaceae bacterium]|nr:tetratricopeptide repeat protein [Halieaceae bacterium]
LGWRYDITDHGLVRTSSVEDDEIDPASLRIGAIDYLVIAALLAVVGAAAWQLLPRIQEQAENRPRFASEHPPNTIAILPFEDLSETGSNQYLADGVSDTVIHTLSQLEALKVTARTSSFAYRDLDLPVGVIGDELGVAHLVEGSVQREEDEVRVIARLVDTASGAELWSGYFDRPLQSIFAVQDEIAQSVVVALQSTVLDELSTAVREPYRPPLAAYEAALKGREAMAEDNPGAYERAIRHLERAIALDPGYARAYLDLGRARLKLAMLQRSASRDEIVGQSMEMAEKALGIDPLLADAHAALGQGYVNRKEFDQARAAFARALELNSSSIEAYRGLADLAETTRQYEAGLEHARRMIELDPASGAAQVRVARFLWALSRAEEAVVSTREAIRRNPERTINYTMLSRWLLQMGYPGKSTYWLARGVRLNPDWVGGQVQLCQQWAQIWDFERAETCIRAHIEAHPGDRDAVNTLALLTRDAQAGLENARARAAENPRAWSPRFQLADWLLVDERFREVVDLYSDTFPPLYMEPPQVDAMTVWPATQLLFAYSGLGEDDKLRALGDAGLAYIERSRKLQGTALLSGIEDVLILALLGDVDEAIYRLERAVNRDHSFYAWQLVYGHIPDALAADPRFDEQVQRLARFMERERAWFAEHENDPPQDIR